MAKPIILSQRRFWILMLAAAIVGVGIALAIVELTHADPPETMIIENGVVWIPEPEVNKIILVESESSEPYRVDITNLSGIVELATSGSKMFIDNDLIPGGVENAFLTSTGNSLHLLGVAVNTVYVNIDMLKTFLSNQPSLTILHFKYVPSLGNYEIDLIAP